MGFREAYIVGSCASEPTFNTTKAAKCAKTAIAAHLVEVKAFLDQVSITNSHTPLLLAIQRGHKRIASLLLAAGASPNIVNHKGYNALCNYYCKQVSLVAPVLALYGWPLKEVVFQSYNCCCNKNKLLKRKIKRDILSCIGLPSKMQIGIFSALIKSERFNINAKANSGATPLHFIATNKKSKFLKILLNYPLLEVNTQDSTGSTLLHYVAATNQLETVNGLLRYASIDVNIQNNIGQTALHYAVQYQHVAILKKLLVRAGKGICIQNKKEITPLGLAMHQNNVKMYNLMLSAYKSFRR